MNSRLRLLSGVLLGACVLVVGCSEQPKKERPLFPVHGKLTQGGKPMAKAEIIFTVTDTSVPFLQCSAVADEQGRYVIQTYRLGNEGAPEGEYFVTITWPGQRVKRDPKKDNVESDPDDPESSGGSDRLKGAYSVPGGSKLRAKVLPQDNEIDFKLP